MDNVQKTPLVATLNEAMRKNYQDGDQVLPKALPATVVARNGAVVTVSFDIQSGFTLPRVTVPVAVWKYFRPPVQVGDRGYCVPGDAYLGGASGLGGGTAGLTPLGNLSTLVFVPISRTDFTTRDPDANVLEAPTGAIIRTEDGTAEFHIEPGKITLRTGSGPGEASIIMQNGTIAFTGVLEFGGHDWLTHRHTDVTPGPDDTGPVDPAWP